MATPLRPRFAPLVDSPYEYLTTLAQLNDDAVRELGVGLREHDKELVLAASRRLQSIGTLAAIAAESL